MAQEKAGRRLVLWRHGRTAWNVENRAQGQLDVPLDEVGREQAKRSARHLADLSPVGVWSSDLERCLDTARELTTLLGTEPRVDPRLREYDVGMRGGLTFEEFRDAHPQVHERFFSDPDYHVPGAEHPAEVVSRVSEALRDVAAAIEPGEVAVVAGHGAALVSGLLGFFGAPSSLAQMFAGMDNCAWAVLHEHPARGWQIVDYNARDLPAEQSLEGNPDGPG